MTGPEAAAAVNALADRFWEIERLRREIAEREVAAFDIRRFHDELLGHGSLPLATLRCELPRWVSAAAG